MSFYSDWTGRLYFNKSSFNEALDLLENGNRMNKDQRTALEAQFVVNFDYECPTHHSQLIRSKITPSTYICQDCKNEKKEGLYDVEEIENKFYLDLEEIIQYTDDPGRNYHRVAEKLVELSSSGRIIGSSTDGCFDGYILEKGVDKSFDLIQWGLSHSDQEIKDIAQAIKDGDPSCSSYLDNRYELIDLFIEDNE